jgi:hypothetical protein
MKIVTICEQGNNRAIHAAYLMRYKRKVDGGGFNDVIPIGIKTSSLELQKMLFDWADWIILTDSQFRELIPHEYDTKLKIWNVGTDRFYRPFNKELLEILRNYMEKEYG